MFCPLRSDLIYEGPQDGRFLPGLLFGTSGPVSYRIGILIDRSRARGSFHHFSLPHSRIEDDILAGFQPFVAAVSGSGLVIFTNLESMGKLFA